MSYPRLEQLPGDDTPVRRQWLARAGFVVLAVVVLSGVIYGSAGMLGSTGAQRHTGGEDSRTKLDEGMSAIVQTENRIVVQARIRSVEPGLSALTVTVAGLPEGDTGKWSAILDDGTEIPLTAEAGERGLVTVTVGAPPAGRAIDEVKLDPDETAGDIYFTVE